MARSWWSLAVLGMLPDIDLLFGTHSTYTHSLGAVLIVMAVVAARQWLQREQAPVEASGALTVFNRSAVAGTAYASHLLLDWLGTDTSPPFGIMALWPLSDGFYKAPISWFLPVSRDVWSSEFWTGTTLAAFSEIVIFAPVVWAAVRVRRVRLRWW